ncbi:MAG: coenzyme F420-0:L-glutamate ligase [Chloroflexi bacterium 13_1_40CM_4_68_4]|nr:MAG: coenzyme F420-0:L-glutamate ligase [Chloroflexi bacterium 13_1_40CM_4_68_4]
MAVTLAVIPVEGLPEVRAGDDLSALILESLKRDGVGLVDGDVLAIAQKIVSKAEGRVIPLASVRPRPEAESLARAHAKDPRVMELVLQESKRIVRAERGVIIAETRHGFVCANAGVDRSNAGAPDAVVLLPLDPDASASRLREALARRTGAQVAVVVTDTFGRAWREGQTNVAIGMSGLEAFLRYVGQFDPDGYELRVTEIALGDEIAAATELVMGKLLRRPAAIVRGLRYLVADEGARTYVRSPERDLFR